MYVRFDQQREHKTYLLLYYLIYFMPPEWQCIIPTTLQIQPLLYQGMGWMEIHKYRMVRLKAAHPQFSTNKWKKQNTIVLIYLMSSLTYLMFSFIRFKLHFYFFMEFKITYLLFQEMFKVTSLKH